jgi:hypothetical protein
MVPSAGAHVPFRGNIRSISKVPDELAAIMVGARNAQKRARMSMIEENMPTRFGRSDGSGKIDVCMFAAEALRWRQD